MIKTSLLVLLACVAASSVYATDETKPVTPNASPEAAALLSYLYTISGTHTLTGQHSPPLEALKRLDATKETLGVYPALFGQEFGYGKPGEWDGIDFRQRMVDTAIRRHREGFLITLTWHAVRPTEDEPVTFKDSVQGGLTRAEWNDLLKPGTRLNERWQSQVDVIAFFLRQLKDANVPVLWRPYHEMTGRWFWWGRTPDKEAFKKLWRMLYDRLANFHGLNNLIWVYSPSERKLGVTPYDICYPGADVVDVLATDIYETGFAQRDYDELLALAKGKPIAIGECGKAPPVEIFKTQPRWAWFMLWDPPTADTPRESYSTDRALSVDELPWVLERPAP